MEKQRSHTQETQPRQSPAIQREQPDLGGKRGQVVDLKLSVSDNQPPLRHRSHAVNSVFLIGNVGNDPGVLFEETDRPLMNFTVATDSRWRDKEEVWQTRTDWHRVVARGEVHTRLNGLLTKGSRVAIEGTLRTRSYEKDGAKRYITEVVARDVFMMGTSKRQSLGIADPGRMVAPS